MTKTATAADEMPVFFEGDSADLFGVLTRPTTTSNGTAVVLAWGTGVGPSSGRNAIRTRLARALAGDGFHVMRFDCRGMGESSGDPRTAEFGDPVTADVVAAAGWLRAKGLSRLVLVGNCFGGRKVLTAAPEIPGLAAVALLGSPTRDIRHAEAAVERALNLAAEKPTSAYLRRALRPTTLLRLARRGGRQRAARVVRAKLRGIGGSRVAGEGEVSPSFSVPLAAVLDAGVQVLLLYGDRDDFYPDFERAMDGELGKIVKQAGPLARVRVIDEKVVGFRSLEVQDRLVEEVAGWLSALTAVESPAVTHAPR